MIIKIVVVVVVGNNSSNGGSYSSSSRCSKMHTYCHNTIRILEILEVFGKV